MTWSVFGGNHLLAGLAMLSLLVAAGRAVAQEEAAPDVLERPPLFQVAEKPQPPADPSQVVDPRTPLPGEHPMMPSLRWARAELDRIQAIEDYSATVVKRERIDGELIGPHYIFIKVRHEPFSVYTYFLAPAEKKGQEAIYVEGKNNGKLLAHGVGIQAIVGTVSLDPMGRLAMRDNRYPITKSGILNLMHELITVGEHDAQYGEWPSSSRVPKSTAASACACSSFTPSRAGSSASISRGFSLITS
jgi:hypothetical protein